MLVLSWNLFHGRAVPSAGRTLLGEFAARLAAWEWDVALLQEVPPWWPVALGRACGASARMQLTSRNELLPVRRAIAELAPDLIKSNGGGCNAILVRGEPILDHRAARLRLLPERRGVHAVRVAEGWVANLHGHSGMHAHPDAAAAGAYLDGWAADAPAVLAGDFNTSTPHAWGYEDLGGHRIDRFLGRGWTAAGAPRTLDHGPLSDHAPVLAELRREASGASRRP